jgi:hypothetical protein
MKKHEVIVAVNVPAYATIEIEAGSQAAAERKVAKEIALDPSIIAPRAAMEATAADPDCPALMGWQRRLLGLPALVTSDS